MGCLVFTSSSTAAYSSAFPCACVLAKRTRVSRSSIALKGSKRDSGRLRCLRRVANALAQLSPAFPCSKSLILFSSLWIRSSGCRRRTKGCMKNLNSEVHTRASSIHKLQVKKLGQTNAANDETMSRFSRPLPLRG